jgi:hypothetical protein
MFYVLITVILGNRTKDKIYRTELIPLTKWRTTAVKIRQWGCVVAQHVPIMSQTCVHARCTNSSHKSSVIRITEASHKRAVLKQGSTFLIRKKYTKINILCKKIKHLKHDVRQRCPFTCF